MEHSAYLIIAKGLLQTIAPTCASGRWGYKGKKELSRLPLLLDSASGAGEFHLNMH